MNEMPQGLAKEELTDTESKLLAEVKPEQLVGTVAYAPIVAVTLPGTTCAA